MVVGGISNMHDDEWEDAEAALTKARSLPGGPERSRHSKTLANLISGDERPDLRVFDRIKQGSLAVGIRPALFQLTPKLLASTSIFHVAEQSLVPNNAHAYRRADCPQALRGKGPGAFGIYRLSLAIGTASRSVAIRPLTKHCCAQKQAPGPSI
jgi:hypothetical protein